ncbi:MAG: phage tail protein, partial [Veillonellales bacterium]
MLEIVKLKNPFDRARRETERVDFIPGQVLTDYIPDKEVEFVLNGNFVDFPNLTFPMDGDQVIVMPHVGSGGFKKIIGMVASIWLMGYVGKIANGEAGGIFSGLTGKTLGSYLAAGAVMYVGGRIINAIVPAQKNGLNTGSSSQTYGWDTPQPITGEGGVVGITYGECIPAPQVLERHVETVNGKQYLNLLLCGGMGPVDSISDIKIGSTPIGNFQDVQIETRLGTNDQDPISFFTDTPLDQSVGVQLSTAGFVQTSDSTSATSLEATVEFPGGLYHLNDDGSFGNDSVTFTMQYRKSGDTEWSGAGGKNAICNDSSITGLSCYATAPDETWTINYIKGLFGVTDYFSVVGSVSGYQTNAELNTPYDNGKIKFTISDKKSVTILVASGIYSVTAAQNTAVRQAFRIYGLAAGKYDVKLTITSQNTGSRYCNTCTWSVLTSYNPGTYCRPNKVLVGLRILATNQLSGSIPDVTWRQMRSTVYVWNPTSGKYETRSARNPIWATYDIYHQCRYMKNINTGLMEYVVFGVPHSRIDPYWDEWVEAAAYSDEQVLGTDKTTYENRFEFDAFFDTEMKRFDAAQKAANVGHAVIIPRGNNIGIKCDKPGNMVQVFGEGRTTMSSVQGTFSGTADRARVVEVVYSETGNDFKNTQFLVRTPDWNTVTNVQDNPAQLQLFGVKRRSQAYREGVYALANNTMVVQFVDIGTDIDAMVCEYGDIVGYNHSVSQIGIKSGLIVGATQSTVQIDKTVTLQAGLTYQIVLQLSDDSIVTKNIVAVTVDTDTDTLTVTEPFTVIPQRFDDYCFGETGKVVKPFRLVGVTKDGELRCKLSLAEYVEGVYTGALNYPIVDYTPTASGLADISSMALAEESYRNSDGVNVSLIHVSWILERGKSANEFVISYSEDNLNWKFWESTFDMKSTISGIVPGKKYYVMVRTSNGIQQSTGIVKDITIIGNNGTPPNVADIAIKDLYRTTGDSTAISEILVSWTPPDYIFYSVADVYIRPVEMLSCEITPEMYNTVCSELGRTFGTWKNCGSDADHLTVSGVEMGKTYQIKVVSRSKAGLTADFDTAPYKEYTLTATTYPPSPPQGLTVSITTQCEWDITPSVTANVDFYELRTDQNYGQETGKLWAGNTLKIIKTPPTRSGRAYLYAHNAKGYSDPIWIDWNKELPAAPANVKIAPVLQGIVITCDALPTNVTGINVHLNSGTGDIVYFSQNNSYKYSSTGGIYDVQVAYVDIFGEGVKSAVQTATIIAKVNQALLDAEAVALANVDPTIKDAVSKAQAAAPQLSLDATNSSLTDARTRLATAEGTISTQSASITTLNGEIALAATKETVDALTGRVTTAEGTISAQATLISAKAAQTTVDTLANTVTNNKASVD